MGSHLLLHLPPHSMGLRYEDKRSSGRAEGSRNIRNRQQKWSAYFKVDGIAGILTSRFSSARHEFRSDVLPVIEVSCVVANIWH